MLQVGTIAADETGAAGVSRSEKPVVRPDVVTYSAAISACANAGQRRRALELLHDMRADGVPPNVRRSSSRSGCRGDASVTQVYTGMVRRAFNAKNA